MLHARKISDDFVKHLLTLPEEYTLQDSVIRTLHAKIVYLEDEYERVVARLDAERGEHSATRLAHAKATHLVVKLQAQRRAIMTRKG